MKQAGALITMAWLKATCPETVTDRRGGSLQFACTPQQYAGRGTWRMRLARKQRGGTGRELLLQCFTDAGMVGWIRLGYVSTRADLVAQYETLTGKLWKEGWAIA